MRVSRTAYRQSRWAVSTYDLSNFPELARLYRATAIEPVAAALANPIGAAPSEDIGPTRVPGALRLYIAPIINYQLEAMLHDPATVHKRARAELPALVKLVTAAIRSGWDRAG